MQGKRLNKKTISQQDGVPPHSSKEVRTWLNENFNARWVGRSGSISWATCSPGLMPLDFFFYRDTLKRNKSKRYCRFKGKD